MSPPLAHVGGIPVEEGLLTLAPTACVLGVLVRAKLGGMAAWRRRR